MEQKQIDYQGLWDSCVTNPEREKELELILARANQNFHKYTALSEIVPVPPKLLAAIHWRESSFNWTTHLHNGNILARRTVDVPAGRPLHDPLNGKAYTWEESAVDALNLMEQKLKIDYKNYIWDIPNSCYFLERYNGLGYRKRGINSPYLWAGCQHYTKGYFVADGKFDPEKIARGIGAAVLLKAWEY